MDDRRANIPLITTLKEHKMSQRELAKKVNLPESILSMAINGKYILDSNSRLKIALILGKPEHDLFTNV